MQLCSCRTTVRGAHVRVHRDGLRGDVSQEEATPTEQRRSAIVLSTFEMGYNLFKKTFYTSCIGGTNALWRLSRQLTCDSACDLLGGVQSSLRFPPSGGKSDPDQTLFESLGGGLLGRRTR